jgi:hypothetical protein
MMRAILLRSYGDALPAGGLGVAGAVCGIAFFAGDGFEAVWDMPRIYNAMIVQNRKAITTTEIAAATPHPTAACAAGGHFSSARNRVGSN